MTTEVQPEEPGLAADYRERTSIRPRRPQLPAWMNAYRRRLAVSDALVIAASLAASHFLRFGTRELEVAGSIFGVHISYGAIGIVLWVAWLIALCLADTRDMKIVGEGGEEYRRVVIATATVFGLLAIVGYLTRLEIARGYLTVAAPSGLAALLFERARWRRGIAIRRHRGEASRRVAVVGSPIDVSHICAEIGRVPTAGLRVVATCTPGFESLTHPFVQFQRFESIAALVKEIRAGGLDGVVVASAGDQARQTVRELGWAVEGTGASLLVAPSLTQVAGRRIHLQPVAGVTLMHVEEPKLPRGGQVLKEVLDRAVGTALIVFLLPIFGLVGLAVALTSRGPVFFRQERVGRDGTMFNIWKFRSMRQNADEELHTLLARAGRGGTPLFKLDRDPRVTRVGAFIRKFSLDELPQLFNVVAGQMSLVGPRPQRAAEVELYDDIARRRLLAKPGMTGLWQVSGRSDLPWDEAIRRDIYYVENWSLTFDFLLLWKTIWTVAGGVGAR